HAGCKAVSFFSGYWSNKYHYLSPPDSHSVTAVTAAGVMTIASAFRMRNTLRYVLRTKRTFSRLLVARISSGVLSSTTRSTLPFSVFVVRKSAISLVLPVVLISLMVIFPAVDASVSAWRSATRLLVLDSLIEWF